MDRRQYLALSTVSLSGLAGCSGTESDDDSIETSDEEVNNSNTSEPTNESVADDTESEEDEADSEDVDPATLDSLSLTPERYGPDETVPRGVEIVATISGEAPLENGENELRADIEIQREEQEESLSEQIRLSGEDEYTTFEADVSFPTNSLPPGIHTVSIVIHDDVTDSSTSALTAEFEASEYILRDLEEAEQILEQLNNAQQRMVDRYLSFGSASTIDEVSVSARDYSGSYVRDPGREARQKWSEFDVAAPDALDTRSDLEDTENTVLWEITYHHDSFSGITETIINDLDLLRDLEFEDYSSAIAEYPDQLDSLKSDHEELEDTLSEFEDIYSEIDSVSSPYSFESRIESFTADREGIRDLQPAFESLQSATETIALGAALDESSDRGRREARLDARDRISSARDIVDQSGISTATELTDEIKELADDLEDAASEL